MAEKTIFDTIIPIAIIIFFVFIIGGAFSGPILKFWNWIKGLFEPSEIKSDPSGPSMIVYER
jgi:hypothetical protein